MHRIIIYNIIINNLWFLLNTNWNKSDIDIVDFLARHKGLAWVPLPQWVLISPWTFVYVGFHEREIKSHHIILYYIIIWMLYAYVNKCHSLFICQWIMIIDFLLALVLNNWLPFLSLSPIHFHYICVCEEKRHLNFIGVTLSVLRKAYSSIVNYVSDFLNDKLNHRNFRLYDIMNNLTHAHIVLVLRIWNYIT